MDSFPRLKRFFVVERRGHQVAHLMAATSVGPALGTIGWLAGLLTIFVALSVRAFRRL